MVIGKFRWTLDESDPEVPDYIESSVEIPLFRRAMRFFDRLYTDPLNEALAVFLACDPSEPRRAQDFADELIPRVCILLTRWIEAFHGIIEMLAGNSESLGADDLYFPKIGPLAKGEGLEVLRAAQRVCFAYEDAEKVIEEWLNAVDFNELCRGPASSCFIVSESRAPLELWPSIERFKSAAKTFSEVSANWHA
jgi:hypothetical protein